MAIIKTKFDRGVEGTTNIVDAGTEGTKVASGTTGQRGSTTGQFRFNSTTGKFEGRNANGFVTIEQTPTVTNVSPTEVDSDGGGNISFTVTGTNFSTGDIASFVGNDASTFNASSTTIDSATQITAVAAKSSFANGKEPYDLKITSSGGLSGVLNNQINVDNAPTWTTSAGGVGNAFDDVNITHATIVASDPEGDTVAYSDTTGNLASAGLALGSANGQITGNANDVTSDTTVSFTARATAGGKTADRAFSIIVKDGSAKLDTVDFFGDSSGKSLYKFESDGTDSGGVSNMSFGHPSSGTNESFETGNFGNGVKLSYGGEYGYTSVRNYTNFTVSEWFYPQNLGSYNQDFKGIFGSQSTGQMIISYSRSAYRFGLQHTLFGSGNKEGNADKYTAENTGCPTLSNNTWYQLIWTRDGTDSRIYVNGVLGHTITEDISSISLNASSPTALYMGTASTQLGVNTYGTEGIHDHLRIFNKKLSQSEITELYNFESVR
jgi:hypothetical protein